MMTSATRKPRSHGAMVDGYDCVGNPYGVYGETGVLSHCDGNSAHFELSDP